MASDLISSKFVMELNKFPFAFSDPDDLYAYAHSINDHAQLLNLHAYASNQRDNEWRLVEGFILWRLGNYQDLIIFLRGLHHSLQKPTIHT